MEDDESLKGKLVVRSPSAADMPRAAHKSWPLTPADEALTVAEIRAGEVARESELLFQDDVWNTSHALALIAFKDKRRITDNSWRSLRPLTPAPVEPDPRKALWQWLIDGKIKATLDGEGKPPEFWWNEEYYDILKKYPDACFRRDDLLKLVFPPAEALGPPQQTGTRRNPRRRAPERDRVKKAIVADVEQGHDPTVYAVSSAKTRYQTSDDTFIQARNELEDSGELAAARERYRVGASRGE